MHTTITSLASSMGEILVLDYLRGTFVGSHVAYPEHTQGLPAFSPLDLRAADQTSSHSRLSAAGISRAVRIMLANVRFITCAWMYASTYLLILAPSDTSRGTSSLALPCHHIRHYVHPRLVHRRKLVRKKTVQQDMVLNWYMLPTLLARAPVLGIDVLEVEDVGTDVEASSEGNGPARAPLFRAVASDSVQHTVSLSLLG